MQRQQQTKKRSKPQQQDMVMAQEQEDHCAICLDRHPDYHMTRCPHIFHKKCIANWVFNTEACPICRQRISQQEARQLQRQWDSQKLGKKKFRRLMKCLKDEEPDVEEARRLLSDPAISWSFDDLNIHDEYGFLPVTRAILTGNADLVRLLYDKGTSIWSTNEDNVHPYEVIELLLKQLGSLRQKQHRTQQQEAEYRTLLGAEREFLAMREQVGHRMFTDPLWRYRLSARRSQP